MKKIFKYLLLILILFITCGCDSSKITGKLEFPNNSLDSDFQIETDSPILVRKVEMVQNTLDEDGNVIQVFANYPIESNEKFSNPEFGENLTNKVFFDSISINGTILDENSVISLINQFEDKLVQVDNLPEENGLKFGLSKLNNYYVSISDEWKVGEYRVSFYTLDLDKDTEYTVLKPIND